MTFSSCFDSPQSPPPPLVDVVLLFSLLQENINTVMYGVNCNIKIMEIILTIQYY